MWKLRWSTTVTSTVLPMRARAADRPANPAPTTTTRCMRPMLAQGAAAARPTPVPPAARPRCLPPTVRRARHTPSVRIRRDRAGRPGAPGRQPRPPGRGPTGHVGGTPCSPDSCSDWSTGLRARAVRRAAACASGQSTRSRTTQARLEAELAQTRRAAEERAASFDDVRRQLTDEFARLSSEALRQNADQFLRAGRHPAGGDPPGGRGRPGQAPGGDRAAAGAHRRAARAGTTRGCSASRSSASGPTRP